MSVSLKGIKEKCASFNAALGLTAGKPVAVAANLTVAAASAGADIAGVAVNVDGGIAAVQLDGYVNLSYSGDTAPVVGYGILVADGSGGVKVGLSGISRLITDVDTTNKKVGFIL